MVDWEFYMESTVFGITSIRIQPWNQKQELLVLFGSRQPPPQALRTVWMNAIPRDWWRPRKELPFLHCAPIFFSFAIGKMFGES